MFVWKCPPGKTFQWISVLGENRLSVKDSSWDDKYFQEKTCLGGKGGFLLISPAGVKRILPLRRNLVKISTFRSFHPPPSYLGDQPQSKEGKLSQGWSNTNTNTNWPPAGVETGAEMQRSLNRSQLYSATCQCWKKSSEKLFGFVFVWYLYTGVKPEKSYTGVTIRFLSLAFSK